MWYAIINAADVGLEICPGAHGMQRMHGLLLLLHACGAMIVPSRGCPRLDWMDGLLHACTVDKLD
jgi:hypothetical protein